MEEKKLVCELWEMITFLQNTVQSSLGVHGGLVPGSLRTPKSVDAQVPYYKMVEFNQPSISVDVEVQVQRADCFYL